MNNKRRYNFGLTILASITFILFSFAAFVVKNKKNAPPTSRSTKYPIEVMFALRKRLGGSPTSLEYDHMINAMSKMDVLNHYLDHIGVEITGSLFRKAVLHVYGLNLNKISEVGEGSKLFIYPDEIMTGVRKAFKIEIPSTETDEKIMSLKKAEVMDLFLETNNMNTYMDMIKTVNLIYGINLPGISSLEHSRISLYSKDHWILQNDTDLFVVYTGTGDVDVEVYPTPHFKKQTGLNELPLELQNALIKLGFSYQEKKDVFYYHNPTGETVQNAFKGQTLKAINSVIEKNYMNLT